MRYQKGFTLVEILIASVILGVILVSLFTAFQAGLTAYRRTEEGLLENRGASIFFFQLDQELRNAVPYSKHPFEGTSEKISFPAWLKSYTPEGTEKGIYLIEYRWKHGQVIRTQRKLTNKLKEKSAVTETVLDALLDCRFEFLKLSGEETLVWDKNWENNPYVGLPRGVRVEIFGQSLGPKPARQQILIPHGVLARELG